MIYLSSVSHRKCKIHRGSGNYLPDFGFIWKIFFQIFAEIRSSIMMNFSNQQVWKMSNFEIKHVESLLGKWVNSKIGRFENYLLKNESVRNQSLWNLVTPKKVSLKWVHFENDHFGSRSLRKWALRNPSVRK